MSWIYRECVCFYLFFQAAIDPTVQWRHGKYRLKWGGLAEQIFFKQQEHKKQPSQTNILIIQQVQANLIQECSNIDKPKPSVVSMPLINLMSTSEATKVVI